MKSSIFIAIIAFLLSLVGSVFAQDSVFKEAPEQNSTSSLPQPIRDGDSAKIEFDPKWRFLGREKSQYYLIEFTDYQCQYCQKFHLESFDYISRSFIAKGKIRYVVRDLPLDFHNSAFPLARLGWCAADERKFWHARSALFKNPTDIIRQESNKLSEVAKSMGVSTKVLTSCFKERRHDDTIKKDMFDAAKLGITATPTFILGQRIGNEISGIYIVGAHPRSHFDNKIQNFINKN